MELNSVWARLSERALLLLKLDLRCLHSFTLQCDPLEACATHQQVF